VSINETRLDAVADTIGSLRDAPGWHDWRWQLRNSFTDLKAVESALEIEFDIAERLLLEETLRRFPLSVTPYYLSLIDTEDFRDDPVFKQALPSSEEIVVQGHDMVDPLAEDEDSPVRLITHRYPDRVLFRVSNTCSMYCRHCTRKRTVGDTDSIPGHDEIDVALDYIRQTACVRDVLLSGGDPLMLSDGRLDEVLSALDGIDHVEVVRIGTRMPAVLPQRITEDLCGVLRRRKPVWLNTHFNHPKEITPEAEGVLTRLADSGIPLGNQTVLLAGVNDCTRIILRLVQRLVANRVRPYYLYQCDLSEGLSHFRTPVGKGIEIIENLIGHTSGFAVPTYVVDAPHGGGKIPVMPNYIVSWSSDRVVLRNYEGVICTYREPEEYKRAACNEECGDCERSAAADFKGYESSGVAGLMRDTDPVDALVPSSNERHVRREVESGDE